MHECVPPRLPGEEEAPEPAAFGGVSVKSTVALTLASRYNKQRVVCRAHSSVLEEGVSTFYTLNVLCERNVVSPTLFPCFPCFPHGEEARLRGCMVQDTRSL